LWGGAVVDDGAFTYVFGIEGEFVLSGLRVARTTRGDLGRQPLEYWDGESWDPDPAAAIPVADDVTTMSFLVDGDGWTLVTQGPVYSREITARRAPAPEGPWSEPTVIARAVPPEGGYTYGAALHPELGGDRSNMLLSYSVNGWKEEDLLARPDLYRPRFVRVAVTTPNLDAWYEPASSTV